MIHFDVSRDVSEENSNFSNINDDSNPVCMSGECASFSNSTNTNPKFNVCSFNTSKLQDKILSSHSGLAQEFDQKILESSDLPNKEYIATRNWELYSEDKMKCSSPGVDMMSQNESIMLSDSALKAKPEKYKFPKHDPPARQGLSV